MKDTPRLAKPLSKTQIAALRRALKASGLTCDKAYRKAGVSRAALFRALRGGAVLARTRGKLIGWSALWHKKARA